MKNLILLLLLIPTTVFSDDVRQKTDPMIETLCKHKHPKNAMHVMSCITSQSAARNIFNQVTTLYWPDADRSHPVYRLMIRSMEKSRVLVGSEPVLDWVIMKYRFKRDAQVLFFAKNQEHLYPELNNL